MMPAERVSGAVPVGPDARAQPPRLGNQLLAHHRVEIFVHDTSLPIRYERRLIRVVRRTRFGQHAYQRTALAIIGQPDVCFKMEGMTRPQDAGGNSWPVPSSTSSWAPRISFCNASAWPSGNTGSFAPWMTSVGVSISASRSREELPTSMTKWFTWLDAMLLHAETNQGPARSRRQGTPATWPEGRDRQGLSRSGLVMRPDRHSPAPPAGRSRHPLTFRRSERFEHRIRRAAQPRPRDRAARTAEHPARS